MSAVHAYVIMCSPLKKNSLRFARGNRMSRLSAPPQLKSCFRPCASLSSSISFPTNIIFLMQNSCLEHIEESFIFILDAKATHIQLDTLIDGQLDNQIDRQIVVRQLDSAPYIFLNFIWLVSTIGYILIICVVMQKCALLSVCWLGGQSVGLSLPCSYRVEHMFSIVLHYKQNKLRIQKEKEV